MTKLQIVTLGSWLLSIPYYFISQRLTEDMIAPIRIDLLAICALLATLTLATLIQWLIRQYKLRST